MPEWLYQYKLHNWITFLWMQKNLGSWSWFVFWSDTHCSQTLCADLQKKSKDLGKAVKDNCKAARKCKLVLHIFVTNSTKKQDSTSISYKLDKKAGFRRINWLLTWHLSEREVVDMEQQEAEKAKQKYHKSFSDWQEAIQVGTFPWT